MTTKKPRKRLGELLVDAGLIDDYQLRSALSHQQQWGGRLGKNLIELGLVGERELVAFLAKHFRLPAVDFSRIQITPDVLRSISPELARKHHVVPLFFGEEDGKKFVAMAMSNPTDLQALDELEFATGRKVRPAVSSDIAIEQALAYYYENQGASPWRHDAKSSADMSYSDLIATTREYLKAARAARGQAGEATETRTRPAETPPEFAGAQRTIDMDDGGTLAGADEDDSIVVFGAAGEKKIPLQGEDTGFATDPGPISPPAAPAPSARPSAPSTDDVLRALIGLLIDKGIITREELRQRLRSN